MKRLKEIINKYVDVPKLVWRIWISLWICLGILDLMKLFAGKWYPIVCENQLFINVCNYIDNNHILRPIICFIFYFISSNIMYLTCTNRIKYNKELSFIMPLIISMSAIIKYYSDKLSAFSGILEVLILIIIPIIFNLKNKSFKGIIWNILFPMIVNVLLALYQLNILFVRDIIDIDNIPLFTSLLLQLDYYVFVLITWIGGYYFMGAFGPWFWSREITRLNALKQTELGKTNPDTKLIADIDSKIKRLEKKLEEHTNLNK